MIERHAVQLSEHLTSVHIIGTKVEPDGTTISFSIGSGDSYARRAVMQEVLDMGGPG